MEKEKSKLYRKVNTKAKGVHHNSGGDFKYSRNKNPIENIKPVTDNLNWSFLFLYKNKQISASKPSAIITIDNIKLFANLNGTGPVDRSPSNNTSLEVANAVMATIINQRV